MFEARQRCPRNDPCSKWHFIVQCEILHSIAYPLAAETITKLVLGEEMSGCVPSAPQKPNDEGQSPIASHSDQ
ncbi:hypothetical protein B0O99DRAFT_49788 [Bisporella sp. PMI_857]|nr:hypothetical protein B0O99DRAFT_49788 [Bisporella sp. PMI_857]